MIIKMMCWLSIKQNADLKQLSQDPIGHPIMHLSGIKHATGEAIYCDDMPVVDRELFLTFVTSSRHLQMGSISTWGYRSLRALLRSRICSVTLGHGNTGLLVGPSNPLPQCPLSLFHPQWLEGPHA